VLIDLSSDQIQVLNCDGQVTVADLAANSVDSSKIKDGTTGKAEISTAFMKKVTIPDQNTDSDWDPDHSQKYLFYLIDM
jgi:hypothetical protein